MSDPQNPYNQPPQQPQGGQPQQPYGEQPGQPYGAPQYNQQPPLTPPPPVAPKKKTNIVSIIVAVAVLGAGGWFLWNQFRESQLLQEGNCIVLSGTKKDAKVDEAKCEDTATASWKIAKVLKDGKRCGDNFGEYYVTKNNRTIASYCLQPNMHVNQCYTNYSSLTDFKQVACTSSEAIFKVTKVEAGANKNACGAEEIANVFEGINTTYCAAKPN